MVIMVVTELSLRFRKQHLLHVKFHRRNEKNRGFHLIPKTPFRSMNPKVIGSYTFKLTSQTAYIYNIFIIHFYLIFPSPIFITPPLSSYQSSRPDPSTARVYQSLSHHLHHIQSRTEALGYELILAKNDILKCIDHLADWMKPRRVRTPFILFIIFVITLKNATIGFTY